MGRWIQLALLRQLPETLFRSTDELVREFEPALSRRDRHGALDSDLGIYASDDDHDDVVEADVEEEEEDEDDDEADADGGARKHAAAEPDEAAGGAHESASFKARKSYLLTRQ